MVQSQTDIATPAEIEAICARFDDDPHRMLDILQEVQTRFRCVSPEVMEVVASATGLTRVAVDAVVSFYSFLSDAPKGRVTIRLCDDIVDRFSGLDAVIAAFEAELGIKVGQTSGDGAFSLEVTACIGMCDQAPAAMINDVVLTSLTAERVRDLVTQLKEGVDPGLLIGSRYYEKPPQDRIRDAVRNNIRRAGAVLLGPVPADSGLKKALQMRPEQVIDIIEDSGLRGCGGAGFPAGKKLRHATQNDSTRRFVFCNADEGEPGTFKDRVLLTERAHLMVEGMTVAARAIGAEEGLIYLRGEYTYMRDHILAVLDDRRARGLLGRNIMGMEGSHFDVRLQMGAGSYVCGEAGALISSCEGLPGEPKGRLPLPTERGYLGLPTVVNNVETFCHIARVMDRGAEWFRGMGTDTSPGTKLFSVSGDCLNPGIYELEYGLTLAELLDMAGAPEAAAVMVGGPSGTIIGREHFGRRLVFGDLPTGGAVMIFGPHRNILEIVDYYMGFFVHESCGYCTPCRVGNVFLHKAVQKIRAGQGKQADLDYIREYSATIMETSRCGLGQTSPNPILSTLKNFPLLYSAMLKGGGDRTQPTFDIQDAIEEARSIAQRRSYIFDRDFTQ
ncbi:NAD(P)H-dependent oxidoreductase subunit E [Seohaeicola saemankumensis]|nr:NAD(P)H-dependent oxidoreductase subunit E [Seohaeicola saemankumensis]MCA0871075.1 NAD(P)H-dependent oxidoreductase subunit E [Seohaeicola saemankumensis]